MDIFVTKAILPEEQNFYDYAGKIFQSHVLTNNGPLLRRLEEKLKDFLRVPWLVPCANGTVAIELALHAAKAAGKRVITTPFTYVATVSAPLWIGCEVVFADINEETLAIDPRNIAEVIDDKIAAIIPVDIYGHCCAFSEIAKVAGDIPVVYDAAQAFGAKFDGVSLFNFGDFATCSLHATKVFHTFEGGFVVCKTEEAYERLTLLRAFGHWGDTHYSLGTNAKMSEIHAAMGLSLMDYYAPALADRKFLTEVYDSLLDWKRLRKPAVPAGFESNYAYYPVIFNSEKVLLKIMKELSLKKIFPRRYFYPCLTELPYLRSRICPVAASVAKRVLCLPLYSGLEKDTVEMITATVNQYLA